MTRDGLRTKRETRKALRAAQAKLGAFRRELISRFGEPAILERSEVDSVLPWSHDRVEVWAIVEDISLRFVSGVIYREEAERIAAEWRELVCDMRSALIDAWTWEAWTKRE